MLSRSTRVFGRRQIAVLLAAFTAFGAFAAYRSTQSADAHETVLVGRVRRRRWLRTCENAFQLPSSHAANMAWLG